MKPDEFAVLREEELSDGQLREVDAGGTRVLLARVKGVIHAVTAACPHYNMPLAEGLLCGSTLHCAYHQSAFDLSTGKLLEPPALDGLVVYPVRVEDGQVLVTATPGSAPTCPPKMVKPDPTTDGRTFVILGGGAAGNAAAQALREFDFRGRIVLVTADSQSPYDRPNLSKEYLSGEIPADYLLLRPAEFYADFGIELLHRQATGVDPAARAIRFSDGSTLTYDKLLLALGATPRELDVPGMAGLENVMTLRTRDDCERLIAAAKQAKNLVVVGSSFIGMETAASLRHRGLAVTVVAPDAAPFERVMGKEVGGFFQRLHERNGVSFRFGAQVARFDGNGKVSAVQLKNGEKLPADLVIVGIGVRPATDFLPAEWRDERGAVAVDEFLRVPSQAETVSAAGDIALYPDARGGGPTRVEHWRVAEQQGRHAARNLVLPPTPFDDVPFFWSYQFGVGLDYVGHAGQWDEVVIDGQMDAGDFTAYYVKAGQITAASGSGRSKQMTALLELMRGGAPSVDLIRNGPVDWEAKLKAQEE
jgi:NADPH-dependent 2,4-dienoyl-CoA reductase/sulfur reductase-like enzyme/nitrite reductase/ring-hydroxylating ferredoxin subunit